MMIGIPDETVKISVCLQRYRYIETKNEQHESWPKDLKKKTIDRQVAFTNKFGSAFIFFFVVTTS